MVNKDISTSDAAFLSAFSFRDICLVKKLKSDMKLLVANAGLDISKTYLRTSGESRKRLEKALQDEYPRLFLTGNLPVLTSRMKLAHAFMGKNHSDRRVQAKKRQYGTSTVGEQATQSGSPVYTEQCLELPPRRHSTNIHRQQKVAAIQENGSQISLTCFPPDTSCAYVSPHLLNVESNQPASSSVCTNLVELEGLHHFLSTCNPPMTHYISRFAAAGCQHIELLRAVSRLPDGLLKEFIEALPNDNDQEMSYTEKIVIRAWFKEYFLPLGGD
ncbi:hypothetical protein BDQ17DRAFT_1350839 [Cyathus striatus]|nr:hypothetical protein BDQ17DRAFT_1350839 [Cyathus striatus]